MTILLGLNDIFCVLNGRDHRSIPIDAHCSTCGGKRTAALPGTRDTQTPGSSISSGNSSRLKSLPAEGDEVIDIESSPVYAADSQHQVFRPKGSQLAPTKQDAERAQSHAHYVEVGKTARAQSIHGRGFAAGRVPPPNTKGGRSEIFHLQAELWLIRNIKDDDGVFFNYGRHLRMFPLLSQPIITVYT